MDKNFNRLKVVLAEKKKTNKWLAEQLGKDPATISKWCTNSAQPGLETLYQIAECLEVDVKDLLISTKEENIIITKKCIPRHQINKASNYFYSNDRFE